MKTSKSNTYTKMQQTYYENSAVEMAKVNHRHHDNNFDYWNCLLQPIRKDSAKWCGKRALDFGCGTGRNICNLIRLAEWDRVDGIDIAANNLEQAKELLSKDGIPNDKYNLYQNNGVDLIALSDNAYDFVMSTIVLQHIAVYDIRYSLLSEVFRAMKSGGVLSFQIGYGVGYGKAEYEDNAYNAEGTNTRHDVIVRSPEQIKTDLDRIGFVDFTFNICKAYSDGHPQWLFVKAVKP